MTIWQLTAFIALMGAIGGLVNAALTDSGFRQPGWEDVGTFRIYRPGFLGNILFGIVAAVLSWGLYGPLADEAVLTLNDPCPTGTHQQDAGRSTADETTKPTAPTPITLANLFGALLIGIGGARWLSDALDKKLLHAAAVEAARGKQDPDKAARIARSSPMEALRIAHNETSL